MTPVYNAREVLEMACQIERNGGRFYRQAALKAEDENVRAVLNGLAEMEEDHEDLFEALQEDLSDDDVPLPAYDPEDDVAHYLRAAADTHVYNVYRDCPDAMADVASAAEALERAIQFEKDTVCFFLGVRDMVPEGLGRAEVDRLIREEMDHITQLSRQMDQLAGE
ncbi:MAG: ferritin family protein [Candidatus Brocadiia bacterium]